MGIEGKLSSPGENPDNTGAWEDTQGTKEVVRPSSSELWNAQAAQRHKGVYN